MLLRKAQRLIRRLPDPIINPFCSDKGPGPESPLERNPQSPHTGWRKRETDGVGLGIVAALQRSDGGRRSSTAAKDIVVVVKISSTKSSHGRFFCGSPPPPVEKNFPMEDFLSCCYLCRKNLQGQDIYMYRGEKAFCSAECRYQHIMNDEFRENYGSEGCRPSGISGTSYPEDPRLFFTGIAAA